MTGALPTGIANGGPSIYIYGSILMVLLHLCIGASLGELASAYPNAGARLSFDPPIHACLLGFMRRRRVNDCLGGQYYWVIMLAPKSCKRFLVHGLQDGVRGVMLMVLLAELFHGRCGMGGRWVLPSRMEVTD